MKNITKNNRVGNGINRTMTNMGDMQTCAVADVHLLVAVVALADVQPIKITSDVIRRAAVHVPDRVGVVGGRGSVHRVLLTGEGMIEAAATAKSHMSWLAADLAGRTIVLMCARVGVASAAATVAASLGAPATSIAP